MRKKIGLDALVCAVFFVGAIGLTGCGKGKGNIKVQLKNASLALSRSDSDVNALTVQFGAKLVGVDLIHDMAGGSPAQTDADGNRYSDPDPDIWVNADCGGEMGGCDDKLTSFFELADPAAANAVLNSQSREVEAGTYKYVRVYFVHVAGTDNITCNGTGESYGIAYPLVSQMAEPLTVSDGDTVTVTLSYDPTGVTCTNETQVQAMFNAMTATATKN